MKILPVAVVNNLRKARDEHHRQFTRIDQVLSLLTGEGSASLNGDRPKRVLSAKARASIAAAQRARWAKTRAAAKPTPTPKSKSAGIASYWASMTPEQRQREIKRRRAVAATKK